MAYLQVDALVASHLRLIPTPTLPLTDACVPLAGACSYILMVLVLKAVPPGKRPAPPKAFMQAYNIAICLASLGMFLSTAYFHISGAQSMRSLYCKIGQGPRQEHISDSLRMCFWVYYASKYFEFLDTVFLILKDKPTSFLHLFHHMVVPITSWSWVRSDLEFASQGVMFNTFVHVWMYLYYYEAAEGRPPSWKRYLTSLQILQFVTSLFLACVYLWFHTTVAEGCASFEIFLLGTAFNSALLLLFMNFYRQSYTRKNKKASD